MIVGCTADSVVPAAASVQILVSAMLSNKGETPRRERLQRQANILYYSVVQYNMM